MFYLFILDEEDDLVEISSDAELAEAIRCQCSKPYVSFVSFGIIFSHMRRDEKLSMF